MAVTRDVEVPATEWVKFVRVGRVERVETLADGTGLVLADGAERLDLDLTATARASISVDGGGDEMRAGLFSIRGVATYDSGPRARVMYLLPLHGRVPVTLAIKDWLWVEA